MDHRELLFLRALRTTGVLDALVETAGSVESVATETPLTHEGAAFALETLTALGYLARVEDTYEPTNELLGFLTTTDIRSIGTLPAALDEVQNLVNLEETLQGLASTGTEDDDLLNALGAAAAANPDRVQAVATAIQNNTPQHSDVLLIEGAPGRLAVALAERGLAVTLADQPLAEEHSAGVLAGSDVQTIATDEWNDLPTTSLAVIAPGLRIESRPWKPLVSAAGTTVEAGGSVVVIERLHEADAADPLMGIQDMATLGRTIDRSVGAVETYLEENGLTVADTSPIADTDLLSVTAEKARD